LFLHLTSKRKCNLSFLTLDIWEYIKSYQYKRIYNHIVKYKEISLMKVKPNNDHILKDYNWPKIQDLITKLKKHTKENWLISLSGNCSLWEVWNLCILYYVKLLALWEFLLYLFFESYLCYLLHYVFIYPSYNQVFISEIL